MHDAATIPGGVEVRLGRSAVKHDPRTLRLARYVTAKLPDRAPSKVDYGANVPEWPMYGNDSLGDCTCAAAGHMIQAWSFAAGAEIEPPDKAILDAYWATGSQDDGRMEIDVLNFWRTTGIGGRKIAAYAAVDPRNHAMIRMACWLFGGVYIGVALPRTAQAQTNWSLVRNAGADGEPGSWGGHAVPIVGYDRRGVEIVTWGRLIRASWGFLGRYMDESYAVLSGEWFTKSGTAPSGFNEAALEADLASIPS